MDTRTTLTEQTSQASSHPFQLGSLWYGCTRTYIWMLIEVSEVSGFQGEYDVELVRMDTGFHACATYTALDWHAWFTRIA